ncbi:tripartite tricarboxylate transporter permease [Halobellus sp. GM3]|uniref:tripartite tricarboxylate transporter permease n=1 Tax=Halobellus sp. GM3 TaxID=3458410 RepID=UPI00403E1493
MNELLAAVDFAVPLQQTGEPMEAIRIAIDTIFTPRNLLYILLATLLGLIAGMFPGLGGPVALALLIPITYPLPANVALMILAANLGGTAFGGSITAILLNTPGDAPNAATVFDGYPLTRQGRAGEAIGASATASALGAILGVVLLIATIPFIRQLSVAFHSVDIFWLALLGLATIAVVTRGSVISDLIAGGFGLILAFHGLNPVTGSARFTWDFDYLLSGVPLVPLIIGVFAIAEMIKLMGERSTISQEEPDIEGVLVGVKAVFKNWKVFLRSSSLGWIIGTVPGAGGTVANFLAYLQAKQTDPDPDSFGKGNINGVIASEAANDAKDGGSMVPTLGLGIPGSASTAVLIGAFVINGVSPGPLLFRENLQIVFIIVFALIISNVLTSLVGLASSKYLIKVTQINVTTLVPIVIIVGLIGSFVIRGQFTDVLLTAGFGVVGFFMVKFGLSRVALIVALVLGPLAEQNFHRAFQISRGDPSILYNRPLSILLILGIVVVLAIPLYRRRQSA